MGKKDKGSSKAKPKKPAAKPVAVPPQATATTFDELAKATGISPNKDEVRDAFLERLADGVNSLSEDAFNALSKTAQNWFNDAAQKINEGKTADVKLEGLPFDAAPAAAPAAESKAEAPTAAPQEAAKDKKNKKPNGKKAESKAPESKGKATEESKSNGDARSNNSLTQHIRIEICKNPQLADEDLVKRLKDRGHKAVDAAYAAGVAHRTRQVLQVKEQVDKGALK